MLIMVKLRFCICMNYVTVCTRKKKYIKYCEKQAGVIKKYFKNDRRYDFLSGNAGAIITIINLYDMTGKEKYLSLALEMGEYLLQHSTQLTRELDGGMMLIHIF